MSCVNLTHTEYGVATISRLLQIIRLLCKRAHTCYGLFCKRDLEYEGLVYVSFAKETQNMKEPTNRSHPIVCVCHCQNLCANKYIPTEYVLLCVRIIMGANIICVLIHTINSSRNMQNMCEYIHSHRICSIVCADNYGCQYYMRANNYGG